MVVLFLQFVMYFAFHEFCREEILDVYVVKCNHFLMLGLLSFEIMIMKNYAKTSSTFKVTSSLLKHTHVHTPNHPNGN